MGVFLMLLLQKTVVVHVADNHRENWWVLRRHAAFTSVLSKTRYMYEQI